MALVLCTGVDPVLMRTRQLILENAGHTVVPASDERETKTVCNQHEFDVAVIGQSISPKGKLSAGACAGTLSSSKSIGALSAIRKQGAQGRGRLAGNAN